MADRWWLCPNDPPCPHGAVLHDVEEFRGDGTETCCVEGCDCAGPNVRSLTASDRPGHPRPGLPDPGRTENGRIPCGAPLYDFEGISIVGYCGRYVKPGKFHRGKHRIEWVAKPLYIMDRQR